MAYDELLHWSAGRPSWQQDTLRRLALHSELTDDDLSELRRQIERDAGLPAENVPDAVPLTTEHLGDAAGNEAKTVLASLGPVQHVDRLAPDQPPLRFAVNGITLIYGANASGKSGYCRIAKQICRSLSSVKLRANVYEREAVGPAKVAVAFRVGDVAEPKEERVWSDDLDPPRELSRISVFDTAAARVYVDKERKIEFLPYELDLMNKLGLACRALETGFKGRLDAADAAMNAPLPEGYNQGTPVQAALARLVPDTALADLPSEHDLRALGTWPQGKQSELETAAEQLNRDPQVMMRLRKEAKQALDTVNEDIASIEEVLADPAIAAIRQKQQEADVKSWAAEAAAHDLFGDQPISDLGSDTWRQMLVYAREFAASVFPDAPPPQLASGGLCVLCHQELGETAAARMAAFDNFIAGRAAEESVTAARTFAEHQDELNAYRVKRRREIETLLAGYAALTKARKENTATVAVYLAKAGERLEAVKGALGQGHYEALNALDPLPDSPASLLDEEFKQLDAEIAELENAERNPQVLAQLRARHAELSDEKRLSEQIEIVVERRNRLEERKRLVACRDQCGSRAITRRITDRRREILTPTLKTALDKELNALGLTHIPLNLADRGDGADSIVEIALTARQRIANNSDVLSEGEQRALALACFLAELGEIGANHGIIVDDPVSSLDHNRMQAVAERLAEEAAKGRQVIVFTHNIVFHYMLWSEARRAGVGRHREWMRSVGNDRFGVIEHDKKPGQMKGVSERLQEIEQEFRTLADGAYDHTDQDFRPALIGLYATMRETWERIIEEILFNNAVQRFRPEVMTQRLEEACYDPATDYPVIFEGMKRCSHYSGHDPAPDIPPDLPDSDRIEHDIRELRAFADIAKNRRKQLGKAPRYEEGAEAILL
tara:strand:+ start:10929 stop:13625 length:2697 start_codon:yes stop_codon:yes gene_type:complete